MKNAVLLVLSILSGFPLNAEDCAPEKTLKIVTANGSPGIPTDGFAAQAKTLYRRGSRFARLEEAPDPEHGIHGLIVVAGSDSWIINLFDRTARHAIDPDPKPIVRIPAFPAPDDTFPKELSSLELGCEDSFFRASPVAELKRDGSLLYKQAIGVGVWSVVLIRGSKEGSPETLFLFRGDEIRSVLKYISYETVDEPDPELFVPPKGLTIAGEGPV